MVSKCRDSNWDQLDPFFFSHNFSHNINMDLCGSSDSVQFDYSAIPTNAMLYPVEIIGRLCVNLTFNEGRKVTIPDSYCKNVSPKYCPQNRAFRQYLEMALLDFSNFAYYCIRQE